MKNLIIFLLIATTNSYATDKFKEYKVSVKADNDFVVKVGVTYSATKKTFFCTELVMSDGEFKRVPKWKNVLYGVNDSGIIVAPKALDGACDYKQRVQPSIQVSIPGKAEAYDTVLIADGVSDVGIQLIHCKEIQISNKNAISCSGALQTDATGNLSVKVISE